MPDDELPRALSAAERVALEALLDHADFAGRDALRMQLDSTTVVGHCPCGCATVDLAVDRAAPPAREARSPIPTDAEVLGDDGEPLGGVIVFVDEAGYLSLLEVYAYEEQPIAPFPAPERLRIY